MLEEGRDARDVQAEAPRGASRAVHAAGKEGVILLPRAGDPSRTRHGRNPQQQGHTRCVQAPGKHHHHSYAPAASARARVSMCVCERLIESPARLGQTLSSAPPEKLKKLQLYTGEEPRAARASRLDHPECE